MLDWSLGTSRLCASSYVHERMVCLNELLIGLGRWMMEYKESRERREKRNGWIRKKREVEFKGGGSQEI